MSKGYRIIKFSAKGDFVVSFAPPGKGPGEIQAQSYQKLNSRDLIPVTDLWQSKIITFDTEGNIVDEVHVDAFPANPVEGKRILRVFTNVNPEGRARVWNVGEPFNDVVEKMYRRLPSPFVGSQFLLKLFKITKKKRSLYDHYMLKLHDLMKEDREYQKEVKKSEIRFPAQSTWIVFTDQVSHAALAGQFLFEQTLYLDVKGQKNPEKSPLKVLEKAFNKPLATC